MILPLRLMLVLCFGLILAACSQGNAQGRASSESESRARQDREATIQQYRKLASESQAALARIGFNVDLEQVTIKVLGTTEVIEQLDRVQNLFLREDHFETYSAFFHGLGLLPNDDPERLRRDALDSLAAQLLALYQPDRNDLIVLSAEGRELEQALTTLPYLVTHELAHAFQDQTVDLEKLFAGRKGTHDGTRTVLGIIEGHAEWLSLATLMDEDALRALDDSTLDNDAAHLIAGELAVTYAAGRRFMAAAFRAGGWKAVSEALANPPTSTEQLLHPTKNGRDLPREVVLPDFGRRVLYRDTLGEQTCYHALTIMGVDRSIAFPAATGWDGDQLLILEAGESEKVSVWRTVWDRIEDAEHYASFLRKAPGVVTIRENVVDWRSDGPQEVLQAIDEALAAHPGRYPLSTRDGESTAAVERAWQKRLSAGPRTEGKIWVHEGCGLSISIEEGWETRRINGVEMLVDDANAMPGLMPNIGVQVMPNPGMDIDAILELNRSQFESIPNMELVSMKKRQFSGHDGIYYEFKGDFNGQKLQFLGLIYLRGSKQVVITGTTSQDAWPKRKSAYARILEGIRIEPLAESGGN